jgi:hypothetical protein
MLLKANRAKPKEVEEAVAELNRLKLMPSLTDSLTPTVSKPTPNFQKGGILTFSFY